MLLLTLFLPAWQLATEEAGSCGWRKKKDELQEAWWCQEGQKKGDLVLLVTRVAIMGRLEDRTSRGSSNSRW